MRARSETVEPLSVIFVVFQTGSQANGGVESITELIEHLQTVRPIVVTQMETPVNLRWRRAGADVHVWSLPYEKGSSFWRSSVGAKQRRIGSFLRSNHYLGQLVRATGSQVVHCNDILALWHGAFGARLAGARVMQSIRDVKPPGSSYGWHWKIARRLSHRWVVLSEEMRAALVQHLSIPEQFGTHSQAGIDRIYSIIDFDRMGPVASEGRQRIRHGLGMSSDEVALGYVANFHPKKAQLAFIEHAGQLLQATVPDCRLYFIGDFDPVANEYARACLNAVQRLGLASMIRFVGYTSEVADWYRALDLVVLASRYEGLARCMIEGLACGTPVISFDVCSAREILEDHSCGIVVPKGEYAALVEQIAAVTKDHARRYQLGQNGTHAARALFEPSHIVQQYEALYQSLSASIGMQQPLTS